MRGGIAGRIGNGGVVTMPRMVADAGTLGRLGRLGQDEDRREAVAVRRVRRFDPLAPLAGLGSEAAYSAGSADVVDVQQDMGSWLSKALKGGGLAQAVGGIANTILPGAGDFINSALKQPGTNQTQQQPAGFAPPPPTTSQAPEAAKGELPKWVGPAAIGVGVLLVALVALRK